MKKMIACIAKATNKDVKKVMSVFEVLAMIVFGIILPTADTISDLGNDTVLI